MVTGVMVKIVDAVVAKVRQVLVSYSEASPRISRQQRQTQGGWLLTSGRNAYESAKGDEKPDDQQHYAFEVAIWSMEMIYKRKGSSCS